jgi:rsbT co-antagonist protein RsbR
MAPALDGNPERESPVNITASSKIGQLLRQHEPVVLESWISLQMKAYSRRADLINEAALRSISTQFLKLFAEAALLGQISDIAGSEWTKVRDALAETSGDWSRKGFTTSETATFIFSLKQPLFDLLRNEVKDTKALLDEIWSLTSLVDKLGLFSAEVFMGKREEIIKGQQAAFLELSTPVIQLWPGVLALPLIGMLDNERIQPAMEALLQEIVRSSSHLVIIDITGVPTVDTQVAQHLMKTAAAARLMGADCIVSGIRPQIAQTIVHLGVELGDLTTKAKLSDAFALALKRLDLAVTPTTARS